MPSLLAFNYLTNAVLTSVTADPIIENLPGQIKNLNWSIPDGTILDDGNDNLESAEFIRTVKVGRVEFSFESRNAPEMLAIYNAGDTTSEVVFTESNAKDLSTGKMTVTLTDVDWQGIDHSVAWGEIASTTLRGVAASIALASA